MSRQGGYGRVGGRRSGSSAWQWLLLGGMFGLLCSAILVLTLLTLDVLSISSTQEPETVTVQVTVPPEDTPAPAPTEEPLPTADVQATIDAAVAAALEQQADESADVGDAVAVVPTATSPAADEPTEDTETTDPGDTTDTTDPVNPPSTDAGTGGGDGGTTGEQPGTDSTTEDQGTVTEPTPEPTPEVDPQLAAVASLMVDIQGGEFQMGTTIAEISTAVRECVDRDGGNCVADFASDAQPPFPVRIDDFRMETTEVTQEQYVTFLNTLGPGGHDGGCFGQLCITTQAENEFSNILFDGLNYSVTFPELNQLPATTVTWFGARAYCEALGRRLPTEAEWEFAAKAPLQTLADDYPLGNRYPWGDTYFFENAQTSRIPDAAGNIVESGGVVDVGSFPAGDTLTGLSDMSGNVAEWVLDWYDASWYSQQQATGQVIENPTGPLAARDRVLRGGSWAAVPFFARTMHRQHVPPTDTQFWIGFRCAADAEQTAISGNGNVDGLGDLSGNTGAVGPDTEAVEQEDVNAAPTLPPAPNLELPGEEDAGGETTEVPAVPPVPDGG